MINLDCSTGGRLEELLKRPTDLLVLVGADPEDTDADADEDEDGDTEVDPKDADADEDEDKDKSKKDEDKDKPKDTVDRAEYDRMTARRNAAEGRLTKALDDIEKLKKDGTSDEALKNELTSLRTENETLRTQVQKLSHSNAFFSDTDHEWVDPEAALRLADLSNVEIDENGVTHGLKPALDKLAKDKPYLLKPRVEEKKAPPKSGDKSSKPGPKSKQDQQQKRAKLGTKYSALRGRG